MPTIIAPVDPQDLSLNEYKATVRQLLSFEQSDGTRRGPRDNDVFVVDNRYLLKQFDNISGRQDTRLIKQLMLDLPLHQPNVFILLPPLDVIARRMIQRPGSFQMLVKQEIPKKVLRAQAADRREASMLKYLIEIATDDTSPSRMLRMSVSGEDCYTLTKRVIGMPVRLYGDKKDFPPTEDISGVHPHNWTPSIVRHGAKLIIPMTPVMSKGKTLLLSTEGNQAEINDNCFWSIFEVAKDRARQRGTILNQSMVSAYMAREVGVTVETLKLKRESRLAGKLLRLPFGRVQAEKGFRRNVVQCCDLVVSTQTITPAVSQISTTHGRRVSTSPPVLPRQRFIFHGVPCEMLDRVCPKLTESVNGRDEKGYLQEWLIMLLLSCDYVTAAKDNRRLKLITNFDPLKRWYEVTLERVTSIYFQTQALTNPSSLGSFGICSQKGTFKSTISNWLTQVTVRGINLFEAGALVDSDDLGDKCFPTFEQQWDEKLTTIVGLDRIGKDLFKNGESALVPEVMMEAYSQFRQLYDVTIAPIARPFFDTSVTRGRSLVFAHCDSEFLDNCFPAPFYRTEININNYSNILNRPGREGGVLNQFILAKCYEMMATSCKPQPLSRVLKTKLIPWWELDTLIKRSGNGHSTADLVMRIPGHVAEEAEWCSHIVRGGYIKYLTIMWEKDTLDMSFFLDQSPNTFDVHVNGHTSPYGVSMDHGTSFLPESFLPIECVYTPVTEFMVCGCPSTCARGTDLDFRGRLSWRVNDGELE
nr:core NTPase [Largemouth bass reovirus]